MIIIGLGANLDSIHGSPKQTFTRALACFPDHGMHVVKVSSVWKTAPVPISDQPWYKNAVCIIKTDHTPHELLQAIRAIEHDFGRVRSVQDAPRVIDLDILCYNHAHIDDDQLQIPHPRLHERAFVLYPLREIAPDWVHPLLNRGIDSFIKDLPPEQEIELA